MLTPQEIQDKKFEKARFGGYDMTQIDDFLDLVLADYTALYKENATLKGKMRVLVDKIEEYRAVDEQMRKALYTAQVSAREIVAKAQSESDAILKNANATAQSQIGDLRGQVELEEKRLAAAKEACSDYARRISAMLSKNIEVIEQLIEAPAEKLTPQSPVQERPAVDTAAYADSIHRAAEQKVAAAQEPATARYVQPQPAEPSMTPPDGSPTPREPEHVVRHDDMETQYYSFDIGDESADEPHKRRGKKSREEESDTAKIFGDSIFTPKPRMDFNLNNLEFGPNYHQDTDKE